MPCSHRFPGSGRDSRALPALLLSGLLALAGCSKDESGGSGAPSGASGGAGPSVDGASTAARANSALLAYQQGVALQLKGELALAEGEFVRATELDDGLSEAFFQLGKLRVGLSSKNVGSAARDQETLQGGLAALARATELEPSNDEYAYWLGRARHLAKDTQGAQQELTRATQLNPRNADAWKRLGMVYLDQARLEQARDAFQKAVAIDPPEGGALFQLGQTLELLEDLPGARAAYERSIAVDRTQPGPYGSLAKLLAKMGEDEAAAEAQRLHALWQDYDEKLMRRLVAVNQRPDDAAALRRLGEAYLAGENWGQAADWCLKSINIDSTDAQAHLYRGVALRHLGDLEGALPHLKEAEFLAPDYLDPKLELLRLYAEQKDEGAFAELLGRVEEAAVADGPSLRDLGLLCQEYGRAEDATRLLDKARALGAEGQ